MPAALEAMRGSLANPAIRRLQLAFAGSAVGQWACGTAVTVFSFKAGGAAAVSLQLVLRMVPAALAAPWLSTFADRYPRVRVMVVAELRSLCREPFLATVAGHAGSAEAAEATAVRRLATARPVAAAG